MSPIPELSPRKAGSVTQWVWRILILFNVAIACLAIQKLYAFASAMSSAQLLVIDTNKTLSSKVDQLDKDLDNFSDNLGSFSKKVDDWNSLFISYTNEGLDRQKKNEQLVEQAKKASDDMMRKLAEFAAGIESDIQDAADASKRAETAANAAQKASTKAQEHSASSQRKILQRLPPPKKPTFLGIPLN